MSLAGTICASSAVLAVSAVLVSATAEPSVPVQPIQARAAIERSLPWLARHGAEWLAGTLPIQGGNGCVSCHHVGFAVWSHHEAERAGIPVDRARIEALERAALRFLTRPEKAHVLSSSPLIAGRPDGEDPLNELRQTLIDAVNDGNGWWRTGGQFRTQNRPIPESDAVTAMWTLYALATLDRTDERVARELREGLQRLPDMKDEPTTEWLAARCALEPVLSTAATTAPTSRLLAAQNPDGGWGWRAGAPSNAFNTGQALYVLAGTERRDRGAPIDRARRFLVETQQDDGTWFTPSVQTSREPSEGKDYIYQFWGTAWAAIGLSRSFVVLPVAVRPTTLTGVYFAGTREAAGAQPTEPLEAVFTPTDDGRFDVAFHFDFQGVAHTFNGTARGSLSDGALEGEVVHASRKTTYVFRGTFQGGEFRGEHAERKPGGDAFTGTLVLR